MNSSVLLDTILATPAKADEALTLKSSGTTSVLAVPEPDLRRYTIAMAELLGIDLDADEIGPVVAQVERVGELVDHLPRQVDDASTMAPRFRP